MKTMQERNIVSQLVSLMWACRRDGLSLTACMASARKQFNKEVNQEALNAPLPK